MKEILLDNLPRWESGGNKGKINWSKSIGQKVKFKYKDIEGEFKITDYNCENRKAKITYKDKEYSIYTNHILECKLGRIVGKITSEFRIDVGTRFKDDKRDLTILHREFRKNANEEQIKYYKYKCNKCGWNEGYANEYDLLNGQGCSCCGKGRRVAVLGINTIWDTNRDWVDKYGISIEDSKKYAKSSHQKITVKCPYCKREKEIKINTINSAKSIGCKCGDGFSKGHKYIHELLNQLNVNFIDNHKPKWCRYYNKYKNKDTYGEYDFIVEDMKLIIEVDGEFHRKDNKMNGQTRKESEYMDNMKDKLAKENGYKVIRIPYKIGDFKENILNSSLSYMFNLSSINWNKCEECSVKNIVKEVCDYWNNKKESETISDLVDIFKLNKSTIINYLKEGTRINWTKYNPDEERIKNNLKTSKTNPERLSKKIEVLNKDNLSLGIFKSARELEKYSEEIFGVKLFNSAVSRVCNGKSKQYKGYIFRFI